MNKRTTTGTRMVQLARRKTRASRAALRRLKAFRRYSKFRWQINGLPHA